MNTVQEINRVREVLRRQHKALVTEDCYVFWLCRYIAAVRGMSRECSGEKKVWATRKRLPPSPRRRVPNVLRPYDRTLDFGL